MLELSGLSKFSEREMLTLRACGFKADHDWMAASFVSNELHSVIVFKLGAKLFEVHWMSDQGYGIEAYRKDQFASLKMATVEAKAKVGFRTGFSQVTDTAKKYALDMEMQARMWNG
jgi:hypothetical protein